MSTKPLMKALVATTTAAVIAVSGVSVASAAPQAGSGVATSSTHVLDKSTAKQLWHELTSAAEQRDAPAVKQTASHILDGLPQTRSPAQANEFNKARSLTAKLPDRTLKAGGTNPLCGLIASVAGVVGNLLNSLLGAGLPLPDVGKLCASVPSTPPVPVPGT
ncbi:hypothetical protein [Sciscionella marina]|uniref:hypothetical protein n=1 Tax=Sciscionella marina TaxID=508770 RepID=UPI0012F68E92|nr:hypothetical protein [Sciscionella marina]